MAYAWSELPNAHHIDWVIASLKTNPKIWTEAQAVRTDARQRSDSECRTMTLCRIAARYAAFIAARAAAEEEVWDTILALVAYDDCDQYLKMDYEKLHVYAILSEKPQAILLLPMVYVREKLNEHALV